MSAVGGSDIPRPSSAHADLILGNLWPLQSESVWGHFAEAIMAAGLRLWGELHGPQADILTLVARQESRDMIPAFLKLIRRRIALLDNRAKAYQMASKQAAGVGTAIWATKFKMAESVAAAESKITAAKNELEPKIHTAESAGQAAVAAALTGELAGRITAAITQGQDEVIGHAAYGAGEIATHQAKIAGWPSPDVTETAGGSAAATPLSTGTGSRAAPAPLSPGDGSSIQPVDYTTVKDGGGAESPVPDKATLSDKSEGAIDQSSLSKQAQEASFNPDQLHPKDAATVPGDKGAPSSPGQSSVPPSASAPSSGGSSAGNPASVVGQMMRPPMSSPASSSPASSSPASSGSGLSSTGATGSPAGAQTGSPAAGAAASGAGAGAGSGAGAARGASVAGLGSGIAEASARMGTGAISATANALGAAGNVVGSQVAQGAAAAAQATPAATGIPPSSAAPPPAPSAAGGAPMAMMPPPAGAATPVVGGPAGGSGVVPGGPNVGPGTPGTPPAASGGVGAGVAGGGASVGGSGANTGPAPVPVLMQQMTPMRALGADGATGEELYGQAVDAAREVVEAMVAQSVKTGRLGATGWSNSNGWSVAASVIQERNGEFSAWLATSVGPSFVHRGVRIPEGVRLAVTDPVVGRELWEATAAAGGADPVEVVARHAEAREAASPGVRVLVLAASLPENRVAGWAAELRTRAVSVDPRPIKGASVSGAGQHRCAVAMPWEWGQANAFDEQGRQRIAAKYMLMAATEGHLHGHAVERVMDKFERRTPITDTDWADVDSAYMQAVIRADFARGGMSLEGEQVAPERAFRTMCAAEVVQCLREFHTAEGCADLLYATRLAGAPLKPADAVA